MTAIHKREARARLSRRPSGWWRWSLQDSLGCELTHPTITTSGMEKAKGRADEKACAAAREYNAQVKQFAGKPVPESERKPSCERKNYET